MAFVVVTSLLGVVDQHLLQPNPFLNNILDDPQIAVSLSNKLRSLQHFLEEPEIQTVNEGLDAKIRDVAVEAEAKIESKLSEVYLASRNGDRAVEACRGLRQTLQHVVKDIESLEARIKIHKESLPVKEPSTPAAAEVESTAQHNLGSGNEMIGCDDEFEKICDMLVDKQLSKNREVIAVTGMGGIGKTTLARRVYEDQKIRSFFDICAWTVVSQQHNVREILICLLGCIVSMTSEIYKKDDGELVYQLLKSLTGQRYLIVVDDIWNTKAWDDIQGCFPDNMNGSRILATTRLEEVAQYVCSSKYIYNIRFRTSDESWNLFVKKVFKGGVCPLPELESIGRKIFQKCRGLPLTIVVIAGLLAKLERSPKQWEDFAQRINSPLMEMESHSFSKILALSYNNLPVHLRACFLYLGIFPEDSDIHVKKLMKLWVAEGFFEPRIHYSLEEIAMSCLYDLIDRSLVLVVKRSFDGKIKSCRLHDVLRDFCLRKAQEENMVVVSNEYRDDLAAEQSSKLGCRWMSCQSRRWPITPSSSLNCTSSEIRSILYFGKDLYLAKCRFEFPRLKLLRVLDLSFIKYWHGMPNEIVDLIHLRYLALTTTGSLCNIQLLKLQNLQTLNLFSWKEECRLHLPCEILDLPWLRHVHLDKGSSLYLPNEVQENLQTLFWLKVSSWDSKTPDFTRVPNLKELGIYIEGEVTADALDSLVQLHQLEKLKFEMGRVECFNLPIFFPPNIKKLTLCNTYLPWEEMDVISKLPNLMVLKLKDFAFCGPKWEPRDGGFQRLKFLLIAHSDLEHWDASYDHFAVLECLVLRCCWYLERLPYGFEEIFTLRLIELIDCCPSLVDSAKMIREEMLEYGMDDLIVRHSLTEDKSSKEESESAV